MRLALARLVLRSTTECVHTHTHKYTQYATRCSERARQFVLRSADGRAVKARARAKGPAAAAHCTATAIRARSQADYRRDARRKKQAFSTPIGPLKNCSIVLSFFLFLSLACSAFSAAARHALGRACEHASERACVRACVRASARPSTGERPELARRACSLMLAFDANRRRRRHRCLRCVSRN